MFYVYELRDPSGRAFYVGKGKGNRLRAHECRARRGIQSHTCAKIRAIWKTGGTVQAVIVFETSDEGAAHTEERRRIALHGRANLTNKTDGGDGVSNPTAEAREKIAAARRASVASDETRARQRAAKLGKRRSQETKTKIASAQRGTRKPWAKAIALRNLAKMLPSKGRKWTEEQRRKFHASRVGHAVSQETRDKIAATKRQRK